MLIISGCLVLATGVGGGHTPLNFVNASIQSLGPFSRYLHCNFLNHGQDIHFLIPMLNNKQERKCYVNVFPLKNKERVNYG